MQKITMHTSRTYDILIEDGLLASAAELIAEILPPPRKCCLVCDKTVYSPSSPVLSARAMKPTYALLIPVKAARPRTRLKKYAA